MDIKYYQQNTKNEDDANCKRCYICDEKDINNLKYFLGLRSDYTNSKIVDIISKLLGEQFTIIIAENDVICLKCLSLINNIDKLEYDLEQARAKIMQNIMTKYKIHLNELDIGIRKDVKLSNNKLGKFAKNIKNIYNSYFCSSCNFSTKEVQEYFDHISSQKCNHPAPEIINNNVATCKDLINSNEKFESEIFIYICQQCNYETNNKLKFDIHRSTHLKSNTICLQCQKLFENTVELQQHLKQHSIFLCQICKHPYSNYFRFRNHLMICSRSDSNKIYKCNKCKRNLSNDTCSFCNKNNDDDIENNESAKVDSTELTELNSDQTATSDVEKGAKEFLGDLLLFKNDNNQMNEKNEIRTNANSKSTISDLLVKENGSLPHKEYRAVYLCAICNYETPIDSEMKIHIDTHAKDGYKCNKCNSMFKSAQMLDAHLSKHASIAQPVNCNICNIECVDKLHLRSHKKNVHKIHLTCHYCKYVCKNRKELQLHIQKHNGNKKFECEDCKQIFTREVLLKCHQEYAHRIDKKCKFCGKEILVLKELRLHEKRHRRQLNSNLKCPHCEKILKTKTGLRVHIAKHTGDYKFFCEICGRGCMSLVVLQEHMGVHTKEERYVCDVCGKKFCFNATYRVHRMWHDNPKPYTCKDCGKNFAHTSLLAVHRRREHTGERPYICMSCNMAFTRSSSLKRHRRIHTGERPYVCVWCKKGFIERNLWAKHLANEHDDYTEINNKQKCEYKMVIKPEQETDSKLITDSDQNNEEEMQEFIIIGNTNLENVVFYGLPSQVVDTNEDAKIHTNIDASEFKATILMEPPADCDEQLKEEQPSQLLEGIDETNIIIKTEEGDMVIRNGQLVPLANIL